MKSPRAKFREIIAYGMLRYMHFEKNKVYAILDFWEKFYGVNRYHELLV